MNKDKFRIFYNFNLNPLFSLVRAYNSEFRGDFNIKLDKEMNKISIDYLTTIQVISVRHSLYEQLKNQFNE